MAVFKHSEIAHGALDYYDTGRIHGLRYAITPKAQHAPLAWLTRQYGLQWDGGAFPLGSINQSSRQGSNKSTHDWRDEREQL